MSIVIENITKNISDMVNGEGYESYRLYDDKGLSLADRIAEVLSSLSVAGEIIDYSVINEAVYNSISEDCGVVSIAWIDNSYQLGHENFVWEIS